ncbi:ssDNA-binding protein [Cysteiniphilum halobium]|uniref:ssDNA-binding protein n=1 Tax=Cysteiniphilum halobium TaxID=2219059 RepID=UPI003F874904
MSNQTLILKNVRIAYPHLYTRPTYNGQTQKFSAKLLLDPKEHAEDIKKLQEQFDQMLKAHNKGAKIPSDCYCLKKGEDTGRPEYEGYYVLTSSSNQQIRVLDLAAGVVSDETQNPVYGGCYVNAKVDFWFLNKPGYSKRICSNLIAVQFYRHGEHLGHVVSEEEAVDGFEACNDTDSAFHDGKAVA